jgi:rubrerythrin
MKSRLSRYLGEVQEFNASIERLNELFIKASEINSMPAGQIRDIQMLRLGIIAEYDAANLYELMAGLVSTPELSKLFLEIANEEKVHIGEFEFALEHMDPHHEKSEDKGEEEAEELTGWEEKEEVEEGIKKSLTENALKQKQKAMQKATAMRCKAIYLQISKRREEIKALILQGRQWDCGE